MWSIIKLNGTFQLYTVERQGSIVQIRPLIIMYPPPEVTAGFLVGRRPIPVNLIMAYGVAVLPAAIAGVALHGVDKAVLHLLPRCPHGRQGRPGGRSYPYCPNQSDDVAGTGFIAVVLPQASVFEPIRAGDTARRLWDHVSVQIPALVGAPTDKAGAPSTRELKPYHDQ